MFILDWRLKNFIFIILRNFCFYKVTSFYSINISVFIEKCIVLDFVVKLRIDSRPTLRKPIKVKMNP